MGGRFSSHSQVCLAVVETAFGNPVLPAPPAVPEEKRDASRVACNASVVHQADKMLRDLVGKKMREFRDTKECLEITKLFLFNHQSFLSSCKKIQS